MRVTLPTSIALLSFYGIVLVITLFVMFKYLIKQKKCNRENMFSVLVYVFAICTILARMFQYILFICLIEGLFKGIQILTSSVILTAIYSKLLVGFLQSISMLEMGFRIQAEFDKENKDIV